MICQRGLSSRFRRTKMMDQGSRSIRAGIRLRMPGMPAGCPATQQKGLKPVGEGLVLRRRERNDEKKV
jgi:hypothetical protein